MFYAFVESDDGQRLKIILPSGTTGGKALLAFVAGLGLYCQQPKEELTHWFAKLDIWPTASLCTITQPLQQAWYNGDWGDYHEDEYQFFVHRSPELNFSEDHFVSAVKECELKWTPIEALMTSVKHLKEFLQQMQPEPEPSWYHPEHTLADLDALYLALTTLASYRCELVRIKFW